MIRGHARAFELETANLRQELQPIFFPGGSADEPPDEAEIGSDDDLQRASKRLYDLAIADNEVIHLAFSISSETTMASNMKAPQFWRSLKSSERLAAKINRREH